MTKLNKSYGELGKFYVYLWFRTDSYITRNETYSEYKMKYADILTKSSVYFRLMPTKRLYVGVGSDLFVIKYDQFI